MSKVKYDTTKAECWKVIKEQNNVCDHCGRKLKPLKTVDNAGTPTYWVGCGHGNKDGWGHFTHGVQKEIYDLAVKMTLLDDYRLGCVDRNDSTFKYSFQEATRKNCDILRKVEQAKNNKQTYTKKNLEEYFNKRK